MKRILKIWPFLMAAGLLFSLLIVTSLISDNTKKKESPWPQVMTFRSHLDHKPFFNGPLKSGEEVTKKCLECHESAAHEVLQTPHWNWKDKTHGIGKVNLINNFCIGVAGNLNSCTKCHAGYGWNDMNFDFKNPKKIDCLVCHEWSGQYVKGPSGIPTESTNLQLAAQSVGYPKRENCGACHYYGGGGMAVKHGDLDGSLANPTEAIDVHMGRMNFQCIDCHKTEKHNISGKAYSVSVDFQGGFDCVSCHKNQKHQDSRINTHMASVSCQACHIPTFARKIPTKTVWDWSKAGNAARKEDTHHYLKIKGEFIYEANVVPTYSWFNKKVSRYLLGDKIDPKKTTELNPPQGSIQDPEAKIWPFKVHLAKQIYDKKYNYLMIPVTSGEGGFWKEFNWDKALKLSEAHTGLKYSGEFDFVETSMHWPLSHMVVPAKKALSCNECHGTDQKRFDWKTLGYDGDPIHFGGRKK